MKKIFIIGLLTIGCFSIFASRLGENGSKAGCEGVSDAEGVVTKTGTNNPGGNTDQTGDTADN